MYLEVQKSVNVKNIEICVKNKTGKFGFVINMRKNVLQMPFTAKKNVKMAETDHFLCEI